MRTLLPLYLAAALGGCASAAGANGAVPAKCAELYASLEQSGSVQNRPPYPEGSEEMPRLLNARRIQRSLADSVESVLSDTVTRAAGLRYRVTREGGVTDVAVVRLSGSAEFDAAAVWALGLARFAPARVDGCPVAVWINQELTGQLRPPRRAAPAPASGVQPPPRP